MDQNHYDLLVLGAGSGNMMPFEEMPDWRVGIVEPDRFGGTCLNRGCIPSKMFVYTADLAEAARQATDFGVQSSVGGIDWPAIRDRVFTRIDPIHERAVDHRRSTGVDVIQAPAQFVDVRTVEVGGQRLTADRILVATGSRPVVPSIPGLDGVAFHTSDTIMRLESFPSSLLVIGGGFIASEMSHVFGALGSEVTIVGRSDRLLPTHDDEISRAFTRRYQERFEVLLNSEVSYIEPGGVGCIATVDTPAGSRSVSAEVVLVATGRRPNTDLLDVEAGGMTLDDHGHVVTDAGYLTTAENTWAIGDATNHFQLKHMANAETRIAIHNITQPGDAKTAAFGPAPSAVFADPQVATIGATEQQLEAEGVEYLSSTRHYQTTAYGWALEDTTSFAKLLADPHTRMVLGAHIIGPQAATLLQPLVQAMALGNTVDQLARDVIYIHPALTEVVENALLDL
ncbi:MAG: mycothione reductase [Microthrixaceae bacterium]